MLDIYNAIGKKACRVDSAKRTVEVVSKNLKVTVEFRDDGKVEITRFNGDGSIADKEYMSATA